MSTSKTTNGDKEKSTPGRGNNSRRRPVGGGEKKKEEDDQQEGGEEAPRRRTADIPVPPELIGTEVTGKIFDIIKRFNGKSYGFILINSETSPKNQKPKIYFSLKDYEETGFVARKGYEIKFKVSKDDLDRLCATNISLTAEGKVAAALREERIAKYREDEEAGVVSREVKVKVDGEKKSRGPRHRREPNETVVPLTATCDGKTEKVTVEAKIFQSIGRLKHSCIEAFGVPADYSIYCQRTPENPEGILLTKVILKQMQEGDNIHLGPFVASPAPDDV